MFRQSTDSAHFHYTVYAHFHYTGVGVQEDTHSKQVGGTHYLNKKVQPWDAMAAWMTHEAFCGFLAGNVIKYLARYKDKGGLDDLMKSRHYLDKLIEVERDKI